MANIVLITNRNMKELGNVIVFKSKGGKNYDDLKGEQYCEEISTDELMKFIAKITDLINEMEEEWEMDHGSITLRDKFHLLRHYLYRLSKINKKQ